MAVACTLPPGRTDRATAASRLLVDLSLVATRGNGRHAALQLIWQDTSKYAAELTSKGPCRVSKLYARQPGMLKRRTEPPCRQSCNTSNIHCNIEPIAVCQIGSCRTELPAQQDQAAAQLSPAISVPLLHSILVVPACFRKHS